MEQIKQIITKELGGEEAKAFQEVYLVKDRPRIRQWLIGILITAVALLFIPWTQNIRTRGTLTTLRQEQRPQELNAVIGGRIVKWHVKEGDFVKTGDTIAQLTEIKEAYMDPELLARTREQIEAKSSSLDAYEDKIETTESQIGAMQQARDLKIEQSNNKIAQLKWKIVSDSIELKAADNDMKIAEEQYRRQLIMRDSGLASMVQVEQRNQAYQQAMSKKIAAEVKLTNTRTDLTNAMIELNQVTQEYAEKIFKSRGEQASARSELAGGRGELAKLSNQFANYSIRNGFYILTAPQDGQVIRAAKAGINEIVKEGEMLVTIVPSNAQYAVELFVKPVDMPLISVGQKVQFLFDGFPAIVFSGWPSASYGLFGGRVAAVESSIGTTGSFRILVAEDPDDRPWPRELKLGTGAQGIALLKDVPLWYELWRNINGFPPDYYKPANTTTTAKDAK